MRSVQSTICESTSPPTTSARSARPAGDHPVRLRERVHEAGAAGREVVRGRVRARRAGRRGSRAVDGKIMSGVTVATMIRSSVGGRRRPPARARCGAAGQRDVGERLLRARDRAARGSRCARRSTRRRCRPASRARRSSSRARARCEPMPVIETRAVRGCVRRSRLRPRRRSAFRARRARRPTVARRPCPCRSGRARARARRSSSSSSPGSTIRLKRTPSMPAKSASRPRFSSCESTATAPVWAIASTISTPGMIGRPGKCPARYHSSAARACARRRASRARARRTSSMRRNGSRCGRISSISALERGAVGTFTRRPSLVGRGRVTFAPRTSCRACAGASGGRTSTPRSAPRRSACSADEHAEGAVAVTEEQTEGRGPAGPAVGLAVRQRRPRLGRCSSRPWRPRACRS